MYWFALPMPGAHTGASIGSGRGFTSNVGRHGVTSETGRKLMYTDCCLGLPPLGAGRGALYSECHQQLRNGG